MVVGQLMLFLSGNTYYSPPFPRGGLAAVFAIDPINATLSASVNFKVELEHKNSEDTTWTTLGTVASVSSTGTTSADLTGIKEECRFAYSFFGGSPTPTDAAHFLVMAPAWRPYP